MNISIGQNFQDKQSFCSLKLKGNGVKTLARDFIRDKALEDTFIKEIALPLKDVEGQVIFDGVNVFYKKVNENFKRLILSCVNRGNETACVVMPLRRNPTMKEVVWTNSAKVFDKEPYDKIELAKNIVLAMGNQSIDVEAIKAADTVNKKAQVLSSAFELF